MNNYKFNFSNSADYEAHMEDAFFNGTPNDMATVQGLWEMDMAMASTIERIAPETEWDAPEIEEDFSLDQSCPLPVTDNEEDFEEVQDKLNAMGIPPLTAIVAVSHGDWNLINKMAALEKATTLLINMRIQAHSEDKAMWQEKIDAKNREMARLVASIDSPMENTRPIYMADSRRKNPLGYSQTAKFQHSPECLIAWRFTKVDEYVSNRDWKHGQSQLIGIVEGIELLFPGTLADIVDTVRRIRNATPSGFIKAVENARAKYMPMINGGHEACVALHVQKEVV